MTLGAVDEEAPCRGVAAYGKIDKRRMKQVRDNVVGIFFAECMRKDAVLQESGVHSLEGLMHMTVRRRKSQRQT